MNRQASEEYERPDYLVNPTIPLQKQQAKDAQHWQGSKLFKSSTTSAAVPIHFLEPHFVRPSPLITLDSFWFNRAPFESGADADKSDSKTAPEIEQLASVARDIMRSELIWLNPDYPSLRFKQLRLDDDETQDKDVVENTPTTYFDLDVIELFENKAYTSPLQPHEEQAVLKAIRGICTNEQGTVTRSQFARESKLEPHTLPMLVEHNHNVAIECLLQILSPRGLASHPDDDFGIGQEHDFLSALVSMDMSLQCMEVVYKLATTPCSVDSSTVSEAATNEEGDSKIKGKKSNKLAAKTSDSIEPTQYLLPTEFLNLFVSNCISSCENIQVEKIQKRSVRLCCIFFQNLIQRKIVDVQAIFVEVQAFCIEFSRFREAVVLFKLLKEMEENN